MLRKNTLTYIRTRYVDVQRIIWCHKILNWNFNLSEYFRAHFLLELGQLEEYKILHKVLTKNKYREAI